ncbi:hypothetical protein LCGC14_0430870 [marine sediment metagenome]|uniref:Uncharacterized protein n=1 Tax=marine sediment metagenome TaxID=412755 RepID=A0A0F9T692_9ZZZZ
MELSIKERMLLQQLLGGVKTNFLTLKKIRVFREELSPTNSEEKKLNLREEGTGDKKSLRWNPIPDREIEIPEAVYNVIKKTLESMDKAEQLSNDFYSLMEKFFPEMEDKKAKEV